MKKLALSVLVALLFIGSGVSGQNADFSDEVAQIVKQSQQKGLDGPIIFIGSSSIRMWNTLEQDFAGFPVLNHGFGGSTYKDLLFYKDQLIENFEPSMVIVYSGDNDIANGKEPDAVANSADQFVDGMRRSASGALVVVISVKPSLARWELKDKYIELNQKLKEMAEGLEHAVFVDVWSLMLNKKGEPDPKLFLEDGLHMNEKGYAIWKNALSPYLSK